ncbi:flagellar basal body P-ring formation chaperone FlgA [Paraburkholderia bonniea]|uniref:flagellar basal body P-ring formation chaperone FlgA n=1 Tax=Paraburkholderia bonniea TaxID=2152891 RepID=UPI002573235D|nr:flagellar basal body P-ring formation chaperone FlgA [Paraburkholderia bonniea]WJF90433.1 flagellar basal body P-ring formation chaperone FlgA [Paraburkholderia bonniea]WJF93748.1 flagellar basal body P-ring formation chaperone FlgA [Paraburkholderia bonniea]
MAALSAFAAPRRLCHEALTHVFSGIARAWLVGLLVGLPLSAHAQASSGPEADENASASHAPIVIPGPAEHNPAALAQLAERLTVTAPVATAAASSTALPAAMASRVPSSPLADSDSDSDRFAQAAQASGAIVIPASGAEASPPRVMTLPPAGAGNAAARPQAAATRVGGANYAMRQQAVGSVNGTARAPTASIPPQPLATRTPTASTALQPAAARASTSSTSPEPDTTRISTASTSPQPGTARAPTASPPLPGQQDGESIRRAALAYLQQQVTGLPGKVELSIAPTFPRGLAACTTLEPFLPTGARLWGRTTVGVRCIGERPWTLYLQARISIHATYYLAARAIAPGELLGQDDLIAREGDLTLLPQAVITEPSQAVGSVALMRIAAGLPLRRDMLKSTLAVSVGQSVRVVAQGIGFAISAEGNAMNNATPGQPVRVRTAAGQIITGIVKDGSTVEIRL